MRDTRWSSLGNGFCSRYSVDRDRRFRFPGVVVLFLLLLSTWAHADAPRSVVSEPRAALPGDIDAAFGPRTKLYGHVVPALSGAVPLAITKSTTEPMTLTIVLRRTDEEGFRRYLDDVYDHASPNFRKFLTPAELTRRFGPSAEDYALVKRYFETQGLAVTDETANRLTLTVKADRKTVQDALSVPINDWSIGNRVVYANAGEPSLPRDVSTHVQAITGLSNIAGLHRPSNTDVTHFLQHVCSDAYLLGGTALEAIPALPSLISGAGFFFEAFSTTIIALEGIIVGSAGLAAGSAALFALPAACIAFWYGLADAKDDAARSYTSSDCLATLSGRFGPPLPGSPLAEQCQHLLSIMNDPPPSATVQKLGLLEFDSFLPSDVADWLALQRIDAANLNRLSTLHVNGGFGPPGPDSSEVLMDVDAVMLLTWFSNTQYVVYDAPQNTSFQQMFNTMINDGVTVISNSWTQCEDQTALADALSIDSVLAQAAAAGISVFNGTGDNGTTCLDGSANTIGVPADSPHATAVGGTTPIFGPALSYGGEQWWNGASQNPPGGGAGGFGTSQFFARPTYQDGFTNSVMRSVPDVSTVADPRFGIEICQASGGGCPSGRLYGGTSLAAPEMAAQMALLNLGLGFNVGNANPLFYAHAGAPAFHSAAQMGSDFAHVGLGSPNTDQLRLAIGNQPIGLPDPYGSIVWMTDTAVPADGTATFVRVDLRDISGNPVSGKTVTLTGSAGSNAVVQPAGGVSTTDGGVIVFQITDKTVENVTFTVTDTTDNIVLAQVQWPMIQFVDPPATSGNIVASVNSVPADGTSTSTVTVTLQNAQNQGARNKVVTLSQGSTHSIIAAPSPAVTDASGQIQFIVTDTVSEPVTYTAVDVTDGDLPIPGSAIVTFTGGGTSCLPAPPTAAPGFTLTPFANGFLAQNFFLGGISFTGCPGASNPAFTSGSVFVTDFPTGDLYNFGAAGGTVSSANKLSNLGQTFGSLVFGKDGSLYGTTFSPPAIVQVDPTTGALMRTVASGFACPYGLAVDPLSGDLFFDDNCVGSIQNASVWRIQNPSGASPTVVVYSTLPGFGNGQIAFSPDGTMYVVCCAFNNANAPVLHISGTNTAAPHNPVAVTGITADTGGIAIGEVQANGAAKSLIVSTGGSSGGAGGSLELIDITTLSATIMANGVVEPGVIGSDGCMYVNAHDTILKLAPAAGPCSFTPSNPSPALALSPATVSPNPAQGSSQTLTATFKNVSVPTGTPVFFEIQGANPLTKLGTTDVTGAASISYTGVLAGNDRIVAISTVANTDYASNTARITWGSGKQVTFLTLNPSPSGGIAGQTVTVAASLTNLSVDPTAPVAGVTITFSIGNQTCNGVTDAQGMASCTLTVPSGVPLTLTASFAGNAQDVGATTSELFEGTAAAPPSSGPSAPTKIPTLSHWALITLAALILLLGLGAMRRRGGN